MAEYIACRRCDSPDCKGCNLKRLETMLENGKFDCLMNENRSINTSYDVETVRHGRWEGYSHSRYCGVDDFGDPIYKDGVVYYCSECRRKTVIKDRYCPKCGARMDGDDDAKPEE